MSDAVKLALAPLRCCGYAPFELGAKWGYLNGPHNDNYCAHVSAMRYCDSCSARWWRFGLEPAWDVDGCAYEDCPECRRCDVPSCRIDDRGAWVNLVNESRAYLCAPCRRRHEALILDPAPKVALAPLVPAGPEEPWSALAAAVCHGYARTQPAADADRFSVVTVLEEGGGL